MSVLALLGCGKAQSDQPDADTHVGMGGSSAGSFGNSAGGVSSAGSQPVSAGSSAVGGSQAASAGSNAVGGSGAVAGAIHVGDSGAAGSDSDTVDPSCVNAVTYSGNVSIEDQAKFNDFPLLAEIDGNLSLSDSVIDLAPLSCLRRIQGTLRIEETLALVDLKGLAQLREVSGSIMVRANAKLAKLEGLGRLKGISELDVEDNPVLRSLDGLRAVEDIRMLTVRANAQLGSLDGLQGLQSAGGLLIQANPLLAELTALSALRQVDRLMVGGNALHTLAGVEKALVSDVLSIGESQLETLETFASLTSVDSLTIANTTRLADLEGLRNLQSVSTQLLLSDNAALTSLQGLRKLTSAGKVAIVRTSVPSLAGLEQLKIAAGGELMLEGCAALTSLEAVSHASTSLHALYVRACPLLTDLSGLEQLQSASTLNIADNSVLGSLLALQGLTQISDALTITGNPKLPRCQALALRASAAAALGDSAVTISGNDNTAPCP
ncbi:MAG TPA: hypothetical protein VGJ91_11065 [Polyangiaceae bacterium]